MMDVIRYLSLGEGSEIGDNIKPSCPRCCAEKWNPKTFTTSSKPKKTGSLLSAGEFAGPWEYHPECAANPACEPALRVWMSQGQCGAAYFLGPQQGGQTRCSWGDGGGFGLWQSLGRCKESRGKTILIR